jgi:hypothetical protein
MLTMHAFWKISVWKVGRGEKEDRRGGGISSLWGDEAGGGGDENSLNIWVKLRMW